MDIGLKSTLNRLELGDYGSELAQKHSVYVFDSSSPDYPERLERIKADFERDMHAAQTKSHRQHSKELYRQKRRLIQLEKYKNTAEAIYKDILLPLIKKQPDLTGTTLFKKAKERIQLMNYGHFTKVHRKILEHAAQIWNQERKRVLDCLKESFGDVFKDGTKKPRSLAAWQKLIDNNSDFKSALINRLQLNHLAFRDQDPDDWYIADKQQRDLDPVDMDINIKQYFPTVALRIRKEVFDKEFLADGSAGFVYPEKPKNRTIIGNILFVSDGIWRHKRDWDDSTYAHEFNHYIDEAFRFPIMDSLVESKTISSANLGHNHSSKSRDWHTIQTELVSYLLDDKDRTIRLGFDNQDLFEIHSSVGDISTAMQRELDLLSDFISCLLIYGYSHDDIASVVSSSENFDTCFSRFFSIFPPTEELFQDQDLPKSFLTDWFENDPFLALADAIFKT